MNYKSKRTAFDGGRGIQRMMEITPTRWLLITRLDADTSVIVQWTSRLRLNAEHHSNRRERKALRHHSRYHKRRLREASRK